MKMCIYWLVFGIFASVWIIGWLKVIQAWSWNDSLTATSWDTLTADKWNWLVAKTDWIKSIQHWIAWNWTAWWAWWLTNTTVTFTKVFSKVPTIIITHDESIDSSWATTCRIQTKSTTWFSYRCWDLAWNDTADNLHWVAIEPY